MQLMSNIITMFIATPINLHQHIDGAEPPRRSPCSAIVFIDFTIYHYLQLDRHWLDHQNDTEKEREEAKVTYIASDVSILNRQHEL